VVTARSIGKLRVGPANYITQTAQNPAFVQLNSDRRPTYYLVNPGTALTNSAITTSGSIGTVQVTGNQLNSEIKTGFDYASYIAGLEGTRGASRIRLLRQRGDLVSSVDSASVRPTQNAAGNSVYSTSTNVNGNGSITGTATAAIGHGRYAAFYSRLRLLGQAYDTGGRTALGNYGAGFFARVRSRNLPPRK
jgi:hypothetical protein